MNRRPLSGCIGRLTVPMDTWAMVRTWPDCCPMRSAEADPFRTVGGSLRKAALLPMRDFHL
jgi:hypothetical protein